MIRIYGFHDQAMWRSISERAMALQRCDRCGAFRYPPGPACPSCRSLDFAWMPLSGEAEVVSWAVFHRQYLPDYPPPYNVIVVKLAEGPLMVSNFEYEKEPPGSWIGAPVELVYAQLADGQVLPRFRTSRPAPRRTAPADVPDVCVTAS